MTTVASASRSPSIKRPQYPTAGSSQPDQNYPNSITPTEEPTFSTLSVIRDEHGPAAGWAMSGMPGKRPRSVQDRDHREGRGSRALRKLERGSEYISELSIRGLNFFVFFVAFFALFDFLVFLAICFRPSGAISERGLIDE
jgi:hypothetical protein